jgi:hypothetical protein
MNPSLTEPGVKMYLSTQFKKNKLFKDLNYAFIFNLLLFVSLLLLVFCFLYFSYKGKLTTSEIMQKNNEKHNFILSKINKYKKYKQQFNYNTITNLPNLEKM